jgi:sec-independent protein translocase protein TatC
MNKRLKQKHNSSLIFIVKEAKFRITWIVFSFFVTFAICYCFSEELFFGLAIPFFKVSKTSFFICTTITESFTTYLIISFILGFFFSIPYVFYQFWCFFSPSFYKNQRFRRIPTKGVTALKKACPSGSLNTKESLERARLTAPSGFCIFSLFALFFALIFTFNWILPNIWLFLYQLSNTKPGAEMFVIKLQPKIYDFSILTLQIFLIMSLCSQIPIIITYFILYNIISVQTLIRNRTTCAFISILFAAMITPPDIWCQLSVCFLAIVLIELTLFISIIREQYAKQIFIK